MAPRVEFHTGIADDVGYACRLLRKACGQGVRVQLLAPGASLQRLDRELWTFVEREFLPHLRVPRLPAAGGRTPQALRTPIWLVEGGQSAADGPAVLVNLGADMPAAEGALDGLTRIVEIVGAEPDEARRGRERWRAYQALGLNLAHVAGA